MQEFYLGLDLSIQLSNLLQQLNITKVFLVRGKNSYVSCGASQIMSEIQTERKIQFFQFSDFTVNPKIEDVDKGVSLCEAILPDAVLAIGGGSTLDTAKLIRHYLLQKTNKYIPLIAIPTTAGTGAEATRFSVCYINGEKHSVMDSSILPDYAFVCPQFTYHNDAYLTACTGFDAVSQAIESYWSVNSTEESRNYSVKALKLLWEQLPLLVRNLDDKQLRAEVAEGAYYAGRAINVTTTTAPHAFSYKFTSLYGIPHGHAIALTFPFFFALNTLGEGLQTVLDHSEYVKRMKLLMQLLNCTESDFVSRQSYMDNYILSLYLQRREFTSNELTAAIDSFNEQRAKNNPVVINGLVIRDLYTFLNTPKLMNNVSVPK